MWSPPNEKENMTRLQSLGEISTLSHVHVCNISFQDNQNGVGNIDYKRVQIEHEGLEVTMDTNIDNLRKGLRAMFEHSFR